METAIALSKRVFSSRKMLDLLLEADETDSDSNPFNNHTKLQLILNKAKSARNVEWCMFAMYLDLFNGIKICYHSLKTIPLNLSADLLRYDGWKNGHLSPDMFTWRGINNSLHGKGTCDLFVGQLELREYLFAKVVP